jgi:hypothetical protein
MSLLVLAKFEAVLLDRKHEDPQTFNVRSKLVHAPLVVFQYRFLSLDVYFLWCILFSAVEEVLDMLLVCGFPLGLTLEFNDQVKHVIFVSRRHEVLLLEIEVQKLVCIVSLLLN